MSSCFGRRKTKGEDTEALLPRYDDETVLQRRVHQKMHTYQMLRALSKGYMPSTEQLVVNLRTILASDVLNPDNPDLSDSGRRLLKYSKQWLMEFIEMLRNKNDRDQIQDFIWFLSKSRVSLDTDHLANTASKVRARADASAGKSLKYSIRIWLTKCLRSLRKPADSRQPSSHEFRFQNVSK